MENDKNKINSTELILLLLSIMKKAGNDVVLKEKLEIELALKKISSNDDTLNDLRLINDPILGFHVSLDKIFDILTQLNIISEKPSNSKYTTYNINIKDKDADAIINKFKKYDINYLDDKKDDSILIRH